MSRLGLALAVVLSLGLFAGPSIADRTAVEDSDDSCEAPDIKDVVATHGRVDFGRRSGVLMFVIHAFEVFDRSGPNLEIDFNIDRDNRPERHLVIDLQSENSFAAAMVYPTGKLRGFANAYTYNAHRTVLRVEFTRDLLKRGIDRFGWRILRYPSEPEGCGKKAIDWVPDDLSWVTHKL